MSSLSALSRALLLGAVTGMRSLLGTAVLSQALSRHKLPQIDSTRLAPLANDKVAQVLSALSAGEIVADKLPAIPARIQPGPLIGRALFGALAGATVCAEKRQSLASGAAVGALAAVATAFGAYHLRQWLDKEVGLPDTVVALVEDALALSLAQRALPS